MIYLNFTIIIIICLSAFPAYSVFNPSLLNKGKQASQSNLDSSFLNNSEKFDDKSLETDQYGNKIAFKIFIPAKIAKNGDKINAKLYSIPYLPENEYLSNVIHVKTKNFYSFNERKKSFPKIQSSNGKSVEIESINAPFERFNSAKLIQYDNDGISNIYEVTFSSDANPYDICKELMNNPEVEYAVPVFRRYISDFIPNDPRLSSQWYLTNIQSSKSWDISKGDSTIVIAIVDSGTDYNHEDLASNIWYNDKEIPNDGIDNDSNGYIDDTKGWDFLGNVSESAAAYGSANPDNDPKPGMYHGTHVAGCAAAVGNNGKGIAGPGFNSKLMIIKCGVDNQNARGIYRGYEGIMYAAEMGAKIINCSWGGEGSSPVEQELINTATNMGSLVVVAAGNSYKNIDYGNSYPACYNNVLCVGATQSNDKKPGFSNFGRLVTVYAPGQSIFSTMPGNNYANQNGTSMATPVVSGICAQVLAVHPDWKPLQILHQIRSTSENVITTDPAQRATYYGRANAYRAVTYNNPKGSNDKIPGIAVSKISYDGNDFLSDFNNKTLELEVTNYIGRANSAKIKITSLQNYVTISKNSFSLGSLDEMQTSSFSLDIRLLASTPWYEGMIDLLVEFTATAYTDYQLIQIPIKLTTKNKFSLLQKFPEQDLPIWYAGISTSFDDVILAGLYTNLGYGTIFKYGQAYNPVKVAEEPLYCLFSPDVNTIYAGSGGGNITEIVKSTNGGFNWTSSNVSAITDFVNVIHFFDNVDGVFVGDPVDGKWGVGLSNNGGTSWSKTTKVPDPLSGEAGLAGCGFGLNNLFWYGTTKGRVILTKDRGKNWQAVTVKANGYIHRIYFSDATSGIALYTNSPGDQVIKVATTQDGGYTWTTDKFNFSSIGVQPFYLYSPKNSRLVIALCKGGEVYGTMDYGNSWQPYLTMKYSAVSFGAAFGESGECRVWSGETELCNLDFEYLPDNPKKTLTVTPNGNIDFGAIVKTQNISLTLENTGNMTIHIDSTVFKTKTGAVSDEFSITFPILNELKAGTSTVARIKFAPLREGKREAQYIIYSDAQEKVKIIDLSGSIQNPLKKISFTPDSVLYFDSVQIGQSKSKLLKFRNSGNVIFNIEEITLDPISENSEFAVPILDGFEIYPLQSSEVSLTFTPSVTGIQEANFRVQTDAGTFLLPVKALAIEPVSVKEISDIKFYSDEPVPNPCNEFTSLRVYSFDEANAEFSIYNNPGQKIESIIKNLQSGFNLINFDTSKLPAGTYYIKVSANNKEITQKFIKQ